jgi:hypothetical protein
MKLDGVTKLLLIALTTLLLLNLLANRPVTARAAGTVQYKYVLNDAKTAQQSEAQLNQLGAEGWELLHLSVSFDGRGPSYQLFIKK